MKKKILIVDDTPANLEAAKAYFANNTDFDFIYATDRKTAEELLPNCNALITDRQIPYMISEKKEDYKLESESDYENSLKMNGYALLAKSADKEIPAVMLSEHGRLMVIKVKNLNDAKSIAEKIRNIHPYAGESFRDEYVAMQINSQTDWYEISKQDTRAWELAFQKLSEELKLNERPAEVPKIKLQ